MGNCSNCIKRTGDRLGECAKAVKDKFSNSAEKHKQINIFELNEGANYKHQELAEYEHETDVESAIKKAPSVFVDKNLDVEAERIADHNLAGDDIDQIGQLKLDLMDKWQKFEYRFPFYKMDVNGYIVHIK